MNYILLFTLFGVLFIGFLKIIYNLIKLNNRKKFTEGYLTKFSKYIISNGDENIYIWLTKNILKIEEEIGSHGIISYRPAFQNYFLNNYNVISNTIPKFKNETMTKADISLCRDVLLKHIGALEEIIKREKIKLLNPIIWFCNFINIIVRFPILLLLWTGIINKKSYIKIKGNVIIKFITLLLTVISLIGSIVTIVVGWENFIKILGL